MKKMLPLTVLFSFLLLQIPLISNAEYPYDVNVIGDLSPATPIWQWEVSSTVLPGAFTDLWCAPPRNSGDPQVFLSWTGPDQNQTTPRQHRIMSCALSELGTCDATNNDTVMELENMCPSSYFAKSNDNVMARLQDGRIVSVFQTPKNYCDGTTVPNTSISFVEARGIDGNDDGLCDEKMEDGKGNDADRCQPGEVCSETCEEAIGDGDGDDDGICAVDAKGLPTEVCKPYKEQDAYVTRVSDDCGQTWDSTYLDATEVRYLNGDPLTHTIYAMDREELYADPWSDHVFMTTRGGDFGWYPFADPDNEKNLYFHASTAGGATALNWELMFTGIHSGFSGMTSMPHSGGVSRLYWFNLCCAEEVIGDGKGDDDGICEKDENCIERPRILYADNPWVPGSTVSVLFVDALLLASEGGARRDYGSGWTNLVGGSPRIKVRNILGNIGITRIWTDGESDVIRVAYLQKDTDTVPGFDYNTWRIVDIQVPAGGTPVAKTNRIIDAASSPGALPRASVYYPSLMQVDHSTAQDPDAATHLLHWTEYRDDMTVVEKVASWDTGKSWVGSADCPNYGDCSAETLWNPDELLTSWNCVGNCSSGDYQYGAFIDTLDACTHRFFVPWGQPTTDSSMKTHGAIVTTTANPFTVDPSEGLTFSGPQLGPFVTPGQFYFRLTNQGSLPIDWTATKYQPWVTLSATSGTLTSGARADVRVTINTNANSLPPGTYHDTVSFTNTANCSYDTRTVTLIVNPPGILEVTPADGLTSSGPQWGPFSPATKVYTLHNAGGSSISWAAANTQSWVSRGPYSGRLESGESTTVTVSINTNANLLDPGTHNDVVSFTNYTNGYGNTTRPVRLTVNTVPGALFVGPSDGFTSSGSQGGIFAPPYKQYSLGNAGGSSFNWTATKTQPWVTLSATSGTIEMNQSVYVQVSINDNAKSLAPGVHSDTVSFTNTTNGNGNAIRTVSLTVEAVGALTVTPADGMTSTGSEGGPFSPSVKVYTLTNTGSDSINWTAAKYYDQQWVSLSASSGTLASGQSATVTVSMNTNANSLGPGSFTDAVIFTNTTSHIGNTSRLVNLSIIGGVPGNLYVGPSEGFTSSGNQGGGFSPPYKVYSLTNTGENPINWTATTYFGNPWVGLSSPTSGTLENGQNATVRVSINTNANSLPPGLHSERVVFTNTTNRIGNTTRPVDLTVIAIPVLGNLYVGPSDGFTSSGNQGGGFSPPYKTYTLVNTGGTPIDWTATNNTQPWISFTASNGTLAGSESIGIAVLINSDANSLAPGPHSDSVVFNNTTNGNGTTFRPVSLTVNTFPGHLSVIQSDGFTSSGNQGRRSAHHIKCIR